MRKAKKRYMPDSTLKADAMSADDVATPIRLPRGVRASALRRRLRVVPGVVWAISAFYLALLICYALLYPPYLGFDETQHLDMTVAVRHDPLSWPDPAERIVSNGVAETSDLIFDRGARRRVGPYLSREATPRAQRPTLQELGDNDPSPTPGRLPNQLVQHPPLYYEISAGLLAVLPRSESLAYDQVLGVLRLLALLMVAPLPLLAWAAARRLIGDGSVAVAAAAVPLAIPGLTRLGASHNNDALVILLASILAVQLAGVMTGDARRGTAVRLGLTLGAALLTKGTALALVPLVPIGYAVAWRRHGGPVPWRPAALALGTSAVGAWWWIRNLVKYGVVQPDGWAGTNLFRERRARPGPHPLREFVEDFDFRYDKRFWSALGYIDSPGLSRFYTRTLTVLVAVLVVVALVRGHRRATGIRPALGVLVLPLLLTTAIVAYGSIADYRRTGLVYGLQGRYSYPGVVGLAVAAVVGLAVVLGQRRERALPVLALGGALWVQFCALHLIVDSFWMPRQWRGSERPAAYWAAFRGLLTWSPWEPEATAPVFLAVIVLGAAAVVGVLRGTRSPRPTSKDAAPA